MICLIYLSCRWPVWFMLYVDNLIYLICRWCVWSVDDLLLRVQFLQHVRHVRGVTGLFVEIISRKIIVFLRFKARKRSLRRSSKYRRSGGVSRASKYRRSDRVGVCFQHLTGRARSLLTRPTRPASFFFTWCVKGPATFNAWRFLCWINRSFSIDVVLIWCDFESILYWFDSIYSPACVCRCRR